MTKNLLLTLFTLIATVSSAQDVYIGPYRSDQNPYYWKNKKPHPGYWQQDVHYIIDAKIDHKAETITATEQLVYWNNSPDTLHELYFHLYQNAFVKGSYMSQLNDANKVRNVYGKYEAAGKGTEVRNILINGLPPTQTLLDNTILKVVPIEPLLPGDSMIISMDFTSYWDHGKTRRRMKCYPVAGWTHFNGVHWYPRVSVYDARKGWDLDQHLNKELYGNFGTFDVSLDFPNNYVVDATGVLQNRAEVLPDSLRELLDLKNFEFKLHGSPPSEIITYDSTIRKKWHFNAVNVHDFAFTADPSYRYGDTIYKGVRCEGLVQESNALNWQNAPEYIRKIIQVYSDDFGDYAYPKIIAADAADGMEYPMLTLDGGGDPGYRKLLAHEIGHNWFYGMLGSNETYRAMLDEGFTQFLTSWAITKIDGPLGYIPPLPEFFLLRFIEKRHYHPRVKYSSNFFRLKLDWLDGEMVDMNRHSNDYHSALHHENGYGEVYYKPSTMLYNMQYVLGDSLFLAAMRNYVSQWKMAHPYVQDFRNSIQDVVKYDMDWFFDQWIETEKKQDYKISKVRQIKNNLYVTLKRKQEIVSPIDISIVNKNGDTSDYYIPVVPFQKETDATVLPKWFGWDKLNKKYEFKVPIEGKFKSAIIDPSGNLTDMYAMDNSVYRKLFPKEKYDIKIALGLKDIPPENTYLFLWRPMLAQNQKDGLRPGINLEGSYMNRINYFKLKVWYDTYVFTKLDIEPEEKGILERMDYRFWYNTIFTHAPKLRWDVYAGHVEGLNDYWTELGYRTDNDWRIGIKARRMTRFDNDYLQMHGQWGVGTDSLAVNSYIELSLLRTLNMRKGVSDLLIKYRNFGLLSTLEAEAKPYSFISTEWKWFYTFNKMQLRTRVYGRVGGEIKHRESALFLGGANTEEMMDNKYYRSKGTFGGIVISDRPSNIQMGGGLNLRAYSGYDIIIDAKNGPMHALNGNIGLSASFELDLDGLVDFKPFLLNEILHIDVYPFFDVGMISQKSVNAPVLFSGLISDAGIGFDAVIKRFFRVDDVHPLIFRFDFPFFMSHPPTGNYLDFRYLIGVSRTF